MPVDGAKLLHAQSRDGHDQSRHW